MVFCSTSTFFCYSSNSPSIGYSVKTLHPSIFCLERSSFNAFALSEKYALLAERNVEFSQ